MQRISLPTQREHAPDFPRDFAWVNTDRSLSFKNDLKGNVVVLDFWTYCCINCMHILPDLEYIEHKYAGQPLMVIGVHSAKFDNESDQQNIQTACARYDIAHPVIVDKNHRIWSEYGVRAWPTLMVIDPEGRIVGTLSGEGNRDILDAVVYSLLEEGREQGTLASAPPTYNRTGRVPSASGLAFPGKIIADPSGQYLFISDSNHDRIIIADTSRNVTAIAGSGQKGQADGSFAAAQFDNPQGLAYDPAAQILYVADTDNHLIRRLDLQAQTVETISGTGRQVYDRTGGGFGRTQGLNSPWDLALYNGILYIAMAGPHQLWNLDTNTLQAQAWVGSGNEDIHDGTGLYAALAQPSGLARKGDWLYFADSEVSAIRKVNLKTREVETLIGSGLFDFGDRDGALRQALLQHPLGVAIYGDDILVADTYNHKVKRIREQAGTIETIAGTEEPQLIASNNGELSLYEPGGLAVHGDALYIADTNHDRIIEYNLKNNTWHELTLHGLQAQEMNHMAWSDVKLQTVPYTSGSDITLQLSANFADGIHLNKEAPINYSLMATGNSQQPLEGLAPAGVLPAEIRLPASFINSEFEYHLLLSIAYCTDGNQSLCVPVDLMWRLNFVKDNSAADVFPLTTRVEPVM